MKRRQFLAAIGTGAGIVSIAKPAIAQSMPEIRWRLTASWPKSLDTLRGLRGVREARPRDHRQQVPDAGLRRW